MAWFSKKKYIAVYVIENNCSAEPFESSHDWQFLEDNKKDVADALNIPYETCEYENLFIKEIDDEEFQNIDDDLKENEENEEMPWDEDDKSLVYRN